jgi:hypothetical protein
LRETVGGVVNESTDRVRNAVDATDERAGCLASLGAAIGTWVASALLAILALYVFQSLPSSRVGQIMGTVLIPHLLVFAVARGRIKRGAHLRRMCAVVMAIEVGLVVLLLLAALV